MKNSTLKAAALACLFIATPLFADSMDVSPSAELSPEDAHTAAFNALSAKVDSLQAASDKGLVWYVNVDTRYDYAPYHLSASQLAGSQSHPYTAFSGGQGLTDLPANGYIGMYVKRAEIEATGKLSAWAVWNLQFELAALKFEDTGIDAKGLDLLPGVDVPGYSWEAKIGLYRQPFGVENQTGSSALPFPERALIDGGYSPVTFAQPTKLVYERIMGVQMITSHSYGAFGYKLQVAVGDDQKDQDPGSSATLGSFAGAISNTYTAATQSLGLTTDQDPSEFGRLGLDLNFFPSIATLTVGVSALHNSNNPALLTSTAKNSWQDNIGYDATMGVPALHTVLQAEWVSQNTFNDSTPGNFASRGEGWYVESTLKPLAFFNKDWTRLDLSGRLENIVPNVDVAGVAPSWVATSEQSTTVGLKFYEVGKTYTSVNYTNYALNGDYSAIAGSSLFDVQQQFNY